MAPSPAVAATRPADFPEALWHAEKNAPDFEKLSAILTRDAVSESRRLSVPAPEAYKAELPKDFVVPQGIEYKFNDADPALAEFRKFANETGMSQEEFSKSLGFYAAAQVSNQQIIDHAYAAEVAKLGANGPARVTQAHTWLDSKGYGAIKAVMVTAEITQAVEKMMRDTTSQGVQPLNMSGREPSLPAGKVSDEQYAKMTDAQKLNYVRGFDQGQFQKSA